MSTEDTLEEQYVRSQDDLFDYYWVEIEGKKIYYVVPSSDSVEMSKS